MIPKIIHYCWFSGEEKPQIIKDCIQTWENVLSDYEIKEWTLDNFYYGNIQFVSQAIHFKKWAFAADYFRLWVLYNYGGIYLDCDVVVNKTFDEVLDNSVFLGWEDLGLLESHIIGSIPHHKWLSSLLDFYKSVNISDVSDYSNYIMPNVITIHSSNNYNLKRNLRKQKLIDNIVVYPIEYFTLNLKDNKNICEHLFLGSWNDTHDQKYLENLISKSKNIYSSSIKRNVCIFKRYLKSVINKFILQFIYLF